VPPGRLVVGAVGRLSPEKGYGDLVRATTLLAAAGVDFELWIAGAGEGRADLERLIETLGLADRVRLLGFRPDTVELYHALDLLVLSSRREGLPNVVLEALAMGVPVVAVAVGGVQWLIEHDRTGLLCPPGQVAALAAALERALRDEPLRHRLACAGRALIERDYTFSHRMAQERAIYDGLLAAGAPPVRPDDRS
jgi:glycosyltransferase involved in cell wall biosynthesis